jgi:hypothetical protein
LEGGLKLSDPPSLFEQWRDKLEVSKDAEHRVKISGGNCSFDELHHFPEGAAQTRIIIADFVEITARVMLGPELVSQAISEVFKGGEAWVQINSLSHKRSQIMDLA